MCGAQQVLGVDLGVLRVDDRGLDRAAQELVRVPAEELVERVLAGDVDRQPATAAPGAPPHLPQARDRARERHADRRVELADVDPELERIGCNDAEQLAAGELSLDLLALGGRVPRAIGSDAIGQLVVETIASVAEDQLDALARLHEADRPGAGRDQLGEQFGRLGQCRPSQPQVLVQ